MKSKWFIPQDWPMIYFVAWFRARGFTKRAAYNLWTLARDRGIANQTGAAKLTPADFRWAVSA